MWPAMRSKALPSGSFAGYILVGEGLGDDLSEVQDLNPDKERKKNDKKVIVYQLPV